MTTRDMDVIADLINRLFVEHEARFRRLDLARLTQARAVGPAVPSPCSPPHARRPRVRPHHQSG
jgi:hypothetical protein